MTALPPTTIDSTEERILAEYTSSVGSALNGANQVLQSKRHDAAEQFTRLGFPRAKDESWKYTNIRQAFDRPFAIAAISAAPAVDAESIRNLHVPGLDCERVVIVNGIYSEELSEIGTLPTGVNLSGLRRAAVQHSELVNRFIGSYSQTESDPFEALNTAFVVDGVFLHVPRNVTLERPVHVINVSTASEPTLVQPRVLVMAEANAAAQLIETTATLGDSEILLNSVVEMYAARDSRLEYYRVQLEGVNTTTVTSTNVFQEEASQARTTTITVGGRLVRNNLHFLPNAENCQSDLTGLVLANGTMHVDNHTSVDHAMPNCVSNELYKTILDEQSTGVFNGRVLVRQDAQKTRAYQSNKAIVLSDGARMYSKPELEIYADDVLCSHGAATGRIDPESIFYLRSRGIDENRARRLMLQAFSRDVTDNIAIEPLRQYVDELIRERL